MYFPLIKGIKSNDFPMKDISNDQNVAMLHVLAGICVIKLKIPHARNVYF